VTIVCQGFCTKHRLTPTIKDPKDPIGILCEAIAQTYINQVVVELDTNEIFGL